MNDTGVNTGRTGTGTETGTEWAGQRGRHVGGNGKQARQARARGTGKNWGPSVGHVPQYWASYDWEGTDSIRHL